MSRDLFNKILGLGKYSDSKSTYLENGIEYGFGFVLGASSAVVLIVLLFFVFRYMIFGI